MKGKKGQALVEFIIVMPILILILVAVFDYVRIIQTKTSLEQQLENVLTDEDYKLDDDIKLKEEVTTDGERSYYLRKSIDIYSPFLTFVMDNPYPVEVVRVVYE